MIKKSEPGTLLRCMSDAVSRCTEIACSEQLMGYTDSARVYADMACEIKNVIPWALARLAERRMLEMEESGELVR